MATKFKMFKKKSEEVVKSKKDLNKMIESELDKSQDDNLPNNGKLDKVSIKFLDALETFENTYNKDGMIDGERWDAEFFDYLKNNGFEIIHNVEYQDDLKEDDIIVTDDYPGDQFLLVKNGELVSSNSIPVTRIMGDASTLDDVKHSMDITNWVVVRGIGNE